MTGMRERCVKRSKTDRFLDTQSADKDCPYLLIQPIRRLARFSVYGLCPIARDDGMP
jgi:hypothetical protein